MTERDLLDELLQAKVKERLFGGDHAPRLGRLVILEPLGKGGMGSVFAAYDPKLDRKVAVKLLRGSGANAARVLREARMLGKLNHPNVVSVYDVAESDGVISIVMEFLPGLSMRSIIGKAEPWRDVVAILSQAAQGLAAAHREGIVHRDVKPENIVLGEDRVRLVDFGLASLEPESPVASEARGSDSLEGSGTPGYMAPELLAGQPASAASDQYAFGVTLYEALHGVRPPAAGASSSEARRAGSAVPSWLDELAARALETDPSRRFTSMDELVTELLHDRRRRRRLGFLGVATLAALAAATWFGYERGKARDVCGAGNARVLASFPLEGYRQTLGEEAWAKKALDDFAASTRAWASSHRRVCEATRVHRTQSEALLELRMRCLDRNFERMSALAARFAAPLDVDARENAGAAVLSIPRPETCETLSEREDLALPDDPADRDRLRKAELALDRAWAAYALGRYTEAKDVAGGIEPQGTTPLPAAFRASWLSLFGATEARLGVRGARGRLEEALGEAARGHVPLVELEVWGRLLRNELFDGEPSRVVEWAPFARAAAARAGAGNAEIDGIEAEARREAGELREAKRLGTRALAAGDELRGDQRALVEMNLGSVELVSGHPVAAELQFSRALASAQAALGKDHPTLGLYLDKLGIAARHRGRIAEAERRHAEALALRNRYGEWDRAVGTSLIRRAQTRIEAGRVREAERDLERARAIRVRVHGEQHRRVGEVDLVSGDAAWARGDAKRAEELWRSAARLDPRLETAPRLALAGFEVPVESLETTSAELSLETALHSAALVALLARAGDPVRAARRADALVAELRACGSDVAPALANDVGVAAERAGRTDAAREAYELALRGLGEEPSRERLRAWLGLSSVAVPAARSHAAEAALALLDKMPELDARARKGLELLAKR